MLTLGLRHVLLLLLFVASLAAAGDLVISVPHRVAEPVELLRDIPERARLRSENLPHIWRHQKHLPQPSEEEIRQALGPPDHVPPRVGFNRPVGSGAAPLELGPSLGWEYLVDGGWLAVVEVGSPGARALRAALDIGSLPDGLELRFFGNDAETVHVVAGSEVLRIIARNHAAGGDAAEADMYWSPVIDGDLLGIELYLPPGQQPEAVRAVLAAISHLVYSPYSTEDGDYQLWIGNSAWCHRDVQCHQAWDLSSRAVARMIFTEGLYSYVCSGTLLNDVPGSGTAYFLTAEHCISSQSAASSLNTFWFYHSTACDSGVLNSSMVQRTGGADLLYAEPAYDTTLLALSNTPPAGAVYAGWTTAAPVLYESASGVHHPAGDLQKISFGSVRSFQNCSASGTGGMFSCSAATSSTGDYIDVLFSEGTVEGGSSGSAIFGRSEPYVMGVLRGGNSSCSNPTGANFYGRFDRAFAGGNFSQWLTEASEIMDLERGVALRDLAGAVGSERLFRIAVPAGARNLSVTTSGGTGDVDLYVRRGSLPTLSTYDCRSWSAGNNETCSFREPDDGEYYVLLHGYGSYEGVSLIVDYNLAFLSCPHDDHLHLRDTLLTGTVSYHACQTITAGPALTISASADVTFGAGYRITLVPGFRVERGGRFLARTGLSWGSQLNDTGITFCGVASSGNIAPCNGTEPWGQDAHYGRDAAALAGMLTKVGGGSAGFDFTKISNSGAELPASATLGVGPNDWACTRDNVTGLIWEVKVDNPSHLRHQVHTYTWYDPNSPDGNPGAQNGGTCLVDSPCDTTGFVKAVNHEALCGASDWRMPTWRELQGIVDYGRSWPAPSIDPGYFPNTPNNEWFWSGSPFAAELAFAWVVLSGGLPDGGAAAYFGRSGPLRVRLVRGGE